MSAMSDPMSPAGRLNAVSIRAALSAALAICLVSIGTAHAELSWSHYGSWGWGDYAPFRPHHYRSWWSDYEPFRRKHRRAHIKYEAEPKAEPQEVPKGPLQIIISIADQRISVYDDGTLIARSSVSTGLQGHPTPIGVFSVIGKPLASLKYLQRSPYALHAADHLVRHRAACRCLARSSGVTRLHSLGKRLCHSTVASHEAWHPGYHRARRCLSRPNSEPAAFFKAENRVQFIRVVG